jgi:hypothetical protein
MEKFYLYQDQLMIHKEKEYNLGNYLLNYYNNLDYLLNLFLLHLQLTNTIFLYYFFNYFFPILIWHFI